MARLRRLRRVSATLAKAFVALVALLLILVGVLLVVIETSWGKNRIRDLLVHQANEYLTATLEIGRLEGSLLRGIQLGDVSLSRNGQPLIRIDEIALSYSIRELTQRGVVIRRVRLTRPRIVGRKQADGRWDLGALIKRESREQERTGPSRPIEVQAIEVIDGSVSLRDPLSFGAAHVPTEFQRLNASVRFVYLPVRWILMFDRVSWVGRAPELSVNRLSGSFGLGPGGWFFDRLSVETPRSAFTLDGGINRSKPAVLDLHVNAPRFAFQEWSGVLRGLANIAVESSFETSLKGPVTALETDVRLNGTGGDVSGHLVLDTSVPGWHGKGDVDVTALNLARWLNRSDRPSDITGHVRFDLALELGRHFPRGVYEFNGRHAMYMGYAADDLRARGQITSTAVLIASATGVSYGANVTTTDGSIGIDRPFPFHFQGTLSNLDLRRVPESVPVPHVESHLALEYDVNGRFSDPFITGHATFAQSEFLGASIGPGTVGAIDTSGSTVQYSGEGDVVRLNTRRFGEGLDVAWLRDPRYAGTISGHFRVEGVGSKSATMTLTGGGHLTRADLFKGVLSDAEVSIDIREGTLTASYDGQFAGIDPAVAFDDARFEAALTGAGRVDATVRDLLTRDVTLADYDVSGSLAVQPSVVRGLHADRATLEAALTDSRLKITRLEASGPDIEGRASGVMPFVESEPWDITYELTRADLGRIQSLTGQNLSGVLASTGRLTGPWTALVAAGDATATEFSGFDIQALSFSGKYDVLVPSGDLSRSTIHADGTGSFLTIAGQAVQHTSAKIAYEGDRLTFDVGVTQPRGPNGGLKGIVQLRHDRREATVLDLTVTLGRAPWRLAERDPRPTLTWDDGGLAITPMDFVDGSADERIDVSGTWRRDGTGALRVTANHVFLETLTNAFEQPTRYGGVVDLDATIRGTRDAPRVSATVTVSQGRVERVTYQQLAGRIEYANENLNIDMRLDQSAGIWVTAAGDVPLALVARDTAVERPINVSIKSSGINLGLLEGLTGVVREVTGELRLDVKAIGTNRDPHFDGRVFLTNAGFVVTSTGSRYKNAAASLLLTTDRITVESMHLEDANSRPLEIRGSLGTHELRVGDLEIEATTRRFEVLRNELGRIEVDAALRLRGRYEAPRIAGDITVSGGNLNVDEILQRTIYMPYGTEPTPIVEVVDAVAALNPWDRLGLDIALHVPNTLRLTGENVQVSPGTPLGLGDINLRVLGDLYLYKDPRQPLFINGSFDQVSGAYGFQGRRFDVQPTTSSINFRGDLNPEIYVTVTRVISGVETRVSITGPLRQPELHLASTPPLDASDIMSLIVFNTSTNQLNAAQQQELIVRAGTIAAGFIATPIVSAIENELGIDVLELEPAGEFGTGPRVTVGEEIAPGLVARFSRQFGQEPYDEATLEYYLSRILRLRATFSDAESLNSRSPFRRVERAGIDLLLFFSF